MTVRKLKPLQCIFYIIGQVLGAFIGAALVYLAYRKQFDEYDGGSRQMTGSRGTADIFFTMPGVGFPHWNALIDQIIGTAILMIFVMAVNHVRKWIEIHERLTNYCS
jgi:glycerol uptake facilitator-like aquaporin